MLIKKNMRAPHKTIVCSSPAKKAVSMMAVNMYLAKSRNHFPNSFFICLMNSFVQSFGSTPQR